MSHSPSYVCKLEHDDHENPEHETIHNIADNADDNIATFHPNHRPIPVPELHPITFANAQTITNTPDGKDDHDHKCPIVENPCLTAAAKDIADKNSAKLVAHRHTPHTQSLKRNNVTIELDDIISNMRSLASNKQIPEISTHKSVPSQNTITLGNQMNISQLLNHDNKNEVSPFNLHRYKKESSTNSP